MTEKTQSQKDFERKKVEIGLPEGTTWLLDVVIPLLTLQEQSIIMMMFRQTYGFKKMTDKISVDQFAFGITPSDGSARSGTGMGKGAVMEAVNNLVKRGVLVRTKEAIRKHGGQGEPAEYMIQQDKEKIDMAWLRMRRNIQTVNRHANGIKAAESRMKKNQKLRIAA